MKPTSKNVLAAFFIAVIFVLGYIPFRQAIIYAKEFFTTDGYNLETYVGKMNAKYGDFLPKDNSQYPGTNKMDYINLNSKMANIFDQKIQNGVIKLNNGYLALYDHVKISPDDPKVTENANNTIDLAKTAELNGADFLYVSTPAKVDKSQFPVGTTPTTREASQKFLGLLKENDIPYISMLEEYEKQGIDPWDMLHRTDHHHTMEGAFLTYKAMSEYILNEYEIENNFKQLDISNYGFEIYPKSVVSGEGERTGKTFCIPDDVQFIYPKFETSLEMKDSVIQKAGSFDDLLVNNSFLDRKFPTYIQPYHAVYYDVFQNGSWVEFNNYSDNYIDKKVLLIGDSQTIRVIPFGAITFKSMYCLYQNDSSAVTRENIDKVIEEYKPDVIIKFEYERNANAINTYRQSVR
ncbi:MAG: hypothetical protein LBL93_04550 [Ruminococcus sp.]|jgi:hypothetical protein|nr:hypothetical protein [Ruminococcus sp.]